MTVVEYPCTHGMPWQHVLDILRKVLLDMHVPLAPNGAPFGTDGGMLFEKLGVKSLLWGPGSIQNAHQPDEWVEVRDLAQAELELPRLLGRLVG